MFELLFLPLGPHFRIKRRKSAEKRDTGGIKNGLTAPSKGKLQKVANFTIKFTYSFYNVTRIKFQNKTHMFLIFFSCYTPVLDKTTRQKDKSQPAHLSSLQNKTHFLSSH